MKQLSKYYSKLLLLFFKDLICLSLALSLAFKPVTSLLVQLSEDKLELLELYGEDDSESEKKEKTDDLEYKNEDLITNYQNSYRISFALESFKKNLKYADLAILFTDFNPDIPLPPPKKDC